MRDVALPVSCGVRSVMRPGLSKRHPERGLALVIVLWIIALLAVLAGVFSSGMRVETHLARNQVEGARVRHLAEAGIYHGLLELYRMIGKAPQAWHANGTVYEVSIAEMPVRIALFDESGKIDLNAAPPELLESLLKSMDVEDQDSARLVDAILDWRDKDNLRRLNGAEDKDYQRAGLPHEAKDGPFQSVPELLLVLGMSSNLYRQLEPALTVYSGRAQVNSAVAPREVLLAMPGMDTARVDSVLEARSQSASEDSLAADSQPVGQARPASQSASTFTIKAESRIGNGATAAAVATIRLARSTTDRPYTILNWQEPAALGYFP